MIKVVASFFVLMVMISAGTFYSLKETTERLEARKQSLSAQILKDRTAIKVLRAEMAYLSQPERLKSLSKRFLALAPSRSFQMAESVNSIAGRDGVQSVSLPVDEFPVLLPQEKPKFQKKNFDKKVVLASYPTKKLTAKTQQVKSVKVSFEKDKKATFYDRISVTLGDEE